MPGPVQTGSHKLDHGRIHHVDGTTEAPGQAPGGTTPEGGEGVLQVTEYLPEDGFRHGAVAGFVGVTEVVTRGRRCPAQGPQRRRPQPQGIADIVEAERMRQLGVEQRHDVAPRTEGARLPIHAVDTGQLWHQMRRNQFDQLPQHRSVPTARLFCVFVFHTLPSGR